MQSKLTQLWNQNDKDASHKKDLTSVIDVISKFFTYFILLTAISAAAYWLFNDVTVALTAFTSVLIVACPCALALSIPFTYGNIMQAFGRVGFYLKKSDVVESLSHIDTVVFDKTGTITYIDANDINFHSIHRDLNEDEKSIIKSLTRQSQHPLSKAIFDSFDSNLNIRHDIKDYMELASSGIKASFGDNKVKMGSAEFVNHTANKGVNPNSSVVYFSIDNEVIGYFSIANKYREGVEELAKVLKQKYDLHIISGDNNAETERLKEIFGEDVNMSFDQSPMDKYEYIKSLNKKGKKVLMIGDGLNDAGALKESYLGISIADDVFNFSPASDAILEAKQFYRLPHFVNYSKSAIRIVYASFGVSFLYNVFGLSYAVSGQLSPIIAAILMPISSVTVVAFVTILSKVRTRKLK
jgi:Cu+-exporting ATPase